MAAPESYRYAAFISYRHVEPDRRWARWLHRTLEGYRVPASARRDLGLPGRIGRAFRDEDEVSASADLNAEIEKALQESHFLIVVCSPRAPGSKWVNREIERFREMGRGDRILALLVEGEPKEAFPPALREIRSVAVPDTPAVEFIEEIEPLAADVRESRLGSRRYIGRMASLRIAATLLGCRFDDLRRRDRERRQRRLVAISVAAMALVLLLGSIALFAVMQWDRAEAALDDYDRLGDVPKLRDLRAEADQLWPCVPSKAPQMRDWIGRAQELEERLPGHHEVLDRLRRSAVLLTAEPRSSDSQRSDSRPTWRLPSASEQFKHDITAKLVSDLTAFVDSDPKMGLLAEMRGRLAFAESVERETLDKFEAKWADAIRSISDQTECPKYQGLMIAPQLGLIPIDKDPASGLWEFSHLQTAAPGADPIPKRGSDGRLIVTESMGLVFVLLPGGTFRMGAVKPDYFSTASDPNVDPEAADNESPVTEVTLEAFFLSKYEMTQGQWLRLVGRNPSTYAPGQIIGGKMVDLRNPVEQVSWEDCDLWLGRLGCVVPTEAQWEYGARGTTTTPRLNGPSKDGLSSMTNLADAAFGAAGATAPVESWNDGYAVHAPVGTFDANLFGLHDTLGNVFEWCRDWLGSYELNPRARDGLRRPPAYRARVIRGGSFDYNASIARSALRTECAPKNRGHNLGVRPARSVSNP
jgi:formylglycine-generating enzyme required for sulfatase activity